MKRLPNKFVVFKIIDGENEEPFESRKEAQQFMRGKRFKNLSIFREEWQRNRNENGRIIGIKLLTKMKLKRL